MTKPSIKAQNLPGIAAVAVTVGLILFMALNSWEIPDVPNTRLLAIRAAVSLIAAAAVLFLAGIFPALFAQWWTGGRCDAHASTSVASDKLN